jgi:hypothetical protein
MTATTTASAAGRVPQPSLPRGGHVAPRYLRAVLEGRVARCNRHRSPGQEHSGVIAAATISTISKSRPEPVLTS